jgi:hypothetical protein
VVNMSLTARIRNLSRPLALIAALAAAPIYSCGGTEDDPAMGCADNSDCRSGRVCIDGRCEYEGGGSGEYTCEDACEGAVSYCNIDDVGVWCLDECDHDNEHSWNRRRGEIIEFKIGDDPLPLGGHCRRIDEDYITCDITYDQLIRCLSDRSCPNYIVNLVCRFKP